MRSRILLASLTVLGWMGVARADVSDCYVCGGYDPSTGTTQICCSSNSGPDGPPGSGIEPPIRPMNYVDSFESWPDGWTTWENCASDGNWFVTQYYDGNDNPAPGGGSHAMRLHTGGLARSCSYPGAYAVSSSVQALSGRYYTFSAYTRNASNSGLMTALFFDANGNLLQVVDQSLTPDAWQFHQQSMRLRSPAGTAYIQMRFGLLTPNQYADIDLASIAQK